MLAEQVHMSPSSFHEHFESVTSMSPLHYQKVLAFKRHVVRGDGCGCCRSALCAAENPARFLSVIDTTFGEKIYIRWCCVDLLSSQPQPDIRQNTRIRRRQGLRHI